MIELIMFGFALCIFGFISGAMFVLFFKKNLGGNIEETSRSDFEIFEA